MAVTRGSTAEPEADELQESVGSVPLIHVSVTPTVDSLVAAGTLATTCLAQNQPFQLSVSTVATRTTGVVASDPTADTVLADWRPGTAAELASDMAHELDVAIPDWLRALGRFDPLDPDSTTLDREAGFGLPDEAELTDLAHTTLTHGPVSGEPSSVGDRYKTDSIEHRALASAVTFDILEETGGTPETAKVLESFLSPQLTPDGPFDTVAGTYDILDVVASIEPGAALGCCCGQSNQDSLLATWRETAQSIHMILDELPGTAEDDILLLDAEGAPTAPLARTIHTSVSSVSTVVCRGRDEHTVRTDRDAHRERIEALDAPLIDHGDGRVTITSTADIDIRSHLEAAA